MSPNHVDQATRASVIPNVPLPPDARFVSIPFPGTDGLQLCVRDSGNGEPAFVLLHGFLLNSGTWRAVFDDFATLGRTVAFDRPPFGHSAKPAAGDWQGRNPYSPAATLSQLLSLLDELRIRRAILVGSSAGGLLAARAALAAPERVAGLVLVAPAVYTRPDERRARSLEHPLVRLAGPLLARALGGGGWLLRRSWHDPSRLRAEDYEQAAIATRYPRWNHALWAYLRVATAQPDISAEVAMIRQPTLVITGMGDRVVPPADGARLAAVLPDGELVQLPAAGHLPHEEQPGAFFTAVRDWLTRRAPA